MRLIAALLAECALIIALTRYGDFTRSGHALRFVLIFFAAAAPYFIAVRTFATARVSPAATFWIATLALRLAAFAMPPADDLWRYIWEGAVQLEGFNPYRFAPQAPELESLRDDVLWPRINHPAWTSIYPPGAQLLFGALAAISGSAWFFKLVFGLSELAATALLLRLNRGDFQQTAWYAWNPLVICMLSGGGHYDGVMLLALVASIHALTRHRPAVSCAWLGAAIALKAVPIFLLPVWVAALRRRSGWLLLTAAIPCAASFCYGGPAIVARALVEFSNVTQFNDLVWWIVEATVWPNPMRQNTRYTVILGLTVTAIAIIFRDDWRRAALWVFGAMLVLSPVLHPWYVTWILPLACWRRAWPWFVLSISVITALLVWEKGPVWEAWRITWPLRAAVLLPPLVAIAAEFIHRPALSRRDARV